MVGRYNLTTLTTYYHYIGNSESVFRTYPENERMWENLPSSTHTCVSFFEGEDTLQ